MRFFYFLLVTILLPCCCFAQLDFTPGSYELNNGTKGVGEIKYNSGWNPTLVVKDKGKKVSYSPEEVKSFRTASQYFIPVSNFIFDSGISFATKALVKYDFAELLDSGRVDLLAYHFIARSSDSRMQNTLLLMRQRGGKLTSIPVGPKKTIPAIAAFLTDRPDLIAQLNSLPRTANLENLRGIIQAYNSGK